MTTTGEQEVLEPAVNAELGGAHTTHMQRRTRPRRPLSKALLAVVRLKHGDSCSIPGSSIMVVGNRDLDAELRRV